MWITAFQIFVGVYTQKFPSEAPKLMKYSEIIRDLAVREYNWRYHDENFRYLRQKDLTAYPWGSVHWELWIRSQPPRYNFMQMKKIDGEPQSGFRVPNAWFNFTCFHPPPPGQPRGQVQPFGPGGGELFEVVLSRGEGGGANRK